MCFHFPSSKACSVQIGRLFLLCLDCALTRRSLSRVVLAHFLGSRPSVIVTGMVSAFPFYYPCTVVAAHSWSLGKGSLPGQRHYSPLTALNCRALSWVFCQLILRSVYTWRAGECLLSALLWQNNNRDGSSNVLQCSSSWTCRSSGILLFNCFGPADMSAVLIFT